MTSKALPPLTRRSFVLGAACASVAVPSSSIAAPSGAPAREIALTAAEAKVALVGPPHPDTRVWCFNGSQPGPEIRVKQGERLRVRVKNELAEETTVHWHGIRLPNAMDGVPHLTQPPIAAGQSFTYEFDCPDAGTFWYHPHQRSFEQVGRGLYGALIVEEKSPIDADRDVSWVLSDWRLLKDASISGDFGHMHDVSHNGRVGNTVTVNGRVRERFDVRPGERLRLRLINAANARIFGLEFAGHRPWIVAVDGHPVAPHVPDGERVIVAPGMRVDLLIDIAAKPDGRFAVTDTFYRNLNYRLLDLVSSGEPVTRSRKALEEVRLPANPLAEPDLKTATRHDVTLGGGMMGSMTSAMMDGKSVDIRTLFHNGLIWAINGIAAKGHMHEPLLTFRRGESAILNMVNETMWHHPMHLHGHAFRVLSRNGKPTQHREWQDTVLLDPRERVEVALVADNPGDWMFHCHILEHQVGGMMGVFKVEA